MKVTIVSVLISTYNRAQLLSETLAALQSMSTPVDCAVEIIIVDNNSSDATPDVIAQSSKCARFPIVSIRERRQGKSFALNAGLEVATGDVVALTDDDVLPAPDWLNRIVDDFRQRDVTFVFGKVLPRWGCEPPPELLTLQARDIWGPLALVDYGDAPADYRADSTSQRLPVGANLAFARSALVRIGGWRIDLGRVNNTLIAGEDHEVLMRLRHFGLYSGYYDPALTVRHFVPAARVTRSYFRKWFFWLGRTHALMLADIYPELDLAEVPFIVGTPRFIYREALQQFWRWAQPHNSDALTARMEEVRILWYLGLLAEGVRRTVRASRRARTAIRSGDCPHPSMGRTADA
jgi:glycosyltransferase involved in cell wall biosynthesis